jgi:hypothetical protein
MTVSIQSSEEATKVTLKYTKAPVPLVVFSILSIAKKGVIVPKHTLFGKVDISVKDEPWDKVLKRVLDHSGVEMIDFGKVALLVRKESRTKQFFSKDVITSMNEILSRPSEPLVKLRFEKAPLRLIASSLIAPAKLTPIENKKIGMQPVTLNVKDLPWDFVLKIVLRMNGLDYTVDGKNIIIDSAKM